MFIAMNHLLFGGVLTVLLIAFAFSMGREMLRNKMEALENRFNSYRTAMIEYHKELALARVYRDAVERALNRKDVLIEDQNGDAAVEFLIYMTRREALDPALSEGATKLINKAKREHGKKIRAQAARLRAKEAKNYGHLLAAKDSLISQWKENALRCNNNAVKARAELSMFQGFVIDVLETVIKLPAVQAKFKTLLNEKHKQWSHLHE